MKPKCSCYAAHSSNNPLISYSIQRRSLGKNDVKINIEFCGVCHTDIHYVKNDWSKTNYPVVPGHEIIGKVIKLGKNVKNFFVGQQVGVGVFVNSCGSCLSCKNNLEQYCIKGPTTTYNSPSNDPGGFTYGGYSENIVVNEKFVLNIPKTLDPASAAPLLCAGITTFSPLKHWKIKNGMTVGIIGLGGLGHMAVKFTKALGAKAVVITSNKNKIVDAKKFGAEDAILLSKKKSFEERKNTFDFLLNTIPVSHDYNKFLNLLKIDGTMCLVGALGENPKLNTNLLIYGRKRITGSLVGGIKETQEMLNFCGDNNISPEIEIIKIQEINKAFERILISDVKYRFVIDMSSI